MLLMKKLKDNLARVLRGVVRGRGGQLSVDTYTCCHIVLVKYDLSDVPL